MGGAGATMPTYRDGLCELSECFAFPVGPRTDGLLACKAHGGVAPVSAARTLPVTPAERVCATVLRAYLAWIDTPEDVPDDGAWEASAVLEDLGEALDMREFLAHEGGPSPAGAALLARVEAAPVLTAEQVETLTDMIDDLKSPASEGWTLPSGQNAIIKAPGGHLSIVHTSSLQRWAGKLREILSAGTAPLDAPPAKEPA